MATSTLSEKELVEALEALGTYVLVKKPEDGKSPTHTTTTSGITGDLKRIPPLPSPVLPVTDPKGSPFALGPPLPSTSVPATPHKVLPPTFALEDYLARAKKLKPPATPAADTGTRPKGPLTSSTPALQTPVMSHDLTQYHFAQPFVPKVSFFSGDDLKGDVPYVEWRFEIRCLVNDVNVTPSALAQTFRKSLRGTAKSVLSSLGESASNDAVLTKLDALFGDVSTTGMLMQEFYNSCQKPDESVTSFGCRLERTLQLAIDHGHFVSQSKNDMLRHKFWPSLASDRLKSQTRHKYDTVLDFDDLLREIRTVEKEISISPSSSSASKKAVHQPVQVDDQLKEVERRWDQKMESMEKRIDSKIDEKFNLILQKLDQKPADHGRSYDNRPQDRQNNFGRGRGYGNPNRYNGRPGYGRGRGRGRGQPQSSGYSQSSQTDPLNG